MSIPNRLPWFAFYPGDFLASTLDMSPATAGAYIRLLSHQWLSGFIPDDAASRDRIAGGSVGVDWECIMRRLVRHSDGWAHPRLLAEKARSNQIAEKRRAHIQRVNDRRSNSHSDCDSDCATTTTTTTTTTSPVGEGVGEGLISEAAMQRIADREPAHSLADVVERQRKYLVSKLSKVGCDDATIRDAWRYACDQWGRKGIRPSDTAKTLTDNTASAREPQSVVRYRMNKTKQKASGSKIAGRMS
jgi:uncharacterized protein YdaU (DUF1376 family)